MEVLGRSGPVVVCLEPGHDLAPLVGCGTALARFLDVTLYLAAVFILPDQRPLDLSDSEEETAEALLEAAAGLVTDGSLAPTEAVWVARNWTEAVQQIVEEVSASALVIGWRASGPLHRFDVGRTLLRAVSCPVIMVGQAQSGKQKPSWPARWLVEAQLQLSE
ncbi:MAG: universal stress protein [Dehalococcoidia bacterium]|nr:universal stress protein [Dehalococcoidia bacterium]